MVKINNEDLKILISAIVDKQKSESAINATISQIKTKALEMEVTVSDKEIKQHLKEVEQLKEAAGKHEQNRLKEQMDLEKKQAAAQNKHLENEYKQRLKLAEQQKRQAEIDHKNRFTDDNLGLDKINLSNKLTQWLNENSKGAETFRDRIEEIRAQIEGADRAQLANLEKQLRNVNSEAESLGMTGKSIFDELKNNISKFASWFGIGAIVAGGVRELKHMISTVQELDKSIVDLQIASGFNRNQVSELMDSYNQLGQRMGATTIEVAKSADSWLRQGYSIEQTNKLIEASMMLSKLGQIDSAEATQYLTSSLKGYKLSVEEATNVVSKLTAVDMEAAVSAGGIAEALARTANGAEIAGISIDKLIGYIATVGEVTQRSLSTVGESFKTIFARMGNIKLGKFIDDESGEDLSDVEKTLSHLDIILRETSGTFRNFGDVLDEVAGRWGSFNDVEKNAIAVAFAGVRQRENFLVLMENYGNALKYTETAVTSFGTATEKMKVYEEGLEASTKRATAAFEALSSTVINSDFLKGAVDTGTGLLGAVNWLLKNLGTIPILIGGITAAMSIKNNAGKVNMPTIYEVNFDTSMWESYSYQIGSEPLNCLERAKAA